MTVIGLMSFLKTMKIFYTFLFCLLTGSAFGQVKSSPWTTTTNSKVAIGKISDNAFHWNGSDPVVDVTNNHSFSIYINNAKRFNFDLTFGFAPTTVFDSTYDIGGSDRYWRTLYARTNNVDYANIGSGKIVGLTVTNMSLPGYAPASGHKSVLEVLDTGALGTNDEANFALTSKTNFIKLNFPRYVDGAGCTIPNTNDFTADTFMVSLFSSSARSNVNQCVFGFTVPDDVDTSGDLVAKLTTTAITGAGGSVGSQQWYDLAMYDSAAGVVPSTPFNHVFFTLVPGNIGSGQVGVSTNTVLVSWKSSITPGDYLTVQLQRRGDEIGDVGGAAYFRDLTISYKAK